MANHSNDPIYIKATLRKRYGSVAAFERAHGLSHDAVRDLLRGKTVARAADALAAELGSTIHSLFPDRFKSRKRDDNASVGAAHRLNAEAR